MSKKYELCQEQYVYIEDDNLIKRKLYRIKALENFSNVKKDELGGFVESEANLSHFGNCWVYDRAAVYDNATISNNATIHDEVIVFENANIDSDAAIYDCVKIHGNALVTEKLSMKEAIEITPDIAKKMTKAQICAIIFRNMHCLEVGFWR